VTNEARIATAIALLLAAGTLEGCTAQVAAARKADAAARGATEPCFGFARASQNDCRTHAHVCAGWSRQDRDPGAFLYLPAGTCARLVGGLEDES